MDTLAAAGTEKSTLQLVEHFSEQLEVHIVYFYNNSDLASDFIKAGAFVHHLEIKGKYGLIQGVRSLKRLLKKEKPALVVSSLWRASIISRLACAWARVPNIGTFVNDSYGKERINEHRGKSYWKFRLFWWIDRATAPLCKAWISNADSIANSNAAALGIPLSRIHVIYRGRKASGVPMWQQPSNKEFRFVFIGRLLERKGLTELIDAFKQVHSNYPDTTLRIIGEGRFRKKLEKKLAEANLESCVQLTGAKQEAWKEIYESHCFVFPSWYEGFSGALVEAMMTGIPLIASDIPMNIEAVEPGKTGTVFEMKNSIALASAMEQVIKNYPAAIQMGEKARKLAQSKFDILVIAAQYEALLVQLSNKVHS